MNDHLERAQILLGRSRPELAAQELRQELASHPDDALAHALLAVSLARQRQFADATAAAERSVHLAPEWAYTHYALASVLSDQDRLAEAERAIAAAIRLNPHDADPFALLAGIRLQRRDWKTSLEAAEEGLRIDS